MELNRKNVKKILFIICFAMVFFWGLNHGPSVLMIFRNLLGILAPFLIGLCFAFVINVLLRPVETLWDKISWGRPSKKIYQIKTSPVPAFKHSDNRRGYLYPFVYGGAGNQEYRLYDY